MPKYESTNRAIRKFQREHYDQTVVKMPKGMKDELKEIAKERGISLNRLILESVERETGLKLTLGEKLPWVGE